MQWRWRIAVITDMDALDAAARDAYGSDEDGRAAIPWRSRCPGPWLNHDNYPDEHVSASGTCNYRAVMVALTPQEIGPAQQMPVIDIYPATGGGLRKAIKDHPDFPWHRLQHLSVDDNDCRSLAAELAELREAWRLENPPEVSEP